VVEHRDPVERAPHIALQTGRSETDGQSKGIQGVLRGVSPTAAMGEEDGLGGVHRAIMAGIGASAGDA
jgi:hypothetical protein